MLPSSKPSIPSVRRLSQQREPSATSFVSNAPPSRTPPSRINFATSSASSDSSIQVSQSPLENSEPPVVPKLLKVVRDPEGSAATARNPEQKSLQQTLRSLGPEGGEKDIYWLPVAVARLGLKNSNVRPAGLNVNRRDLDDPDAVEGGFDPTRAILARWERSAKTEEKLYERQQTDHRKLKLTEAGGADRPDGAGGAVADLDEDDEELQELLDELSLSGPSVNFSRSIERRSKRFTTAFEEEIKQRNDHLRQRMEQMNARVRRFEKGFEALDSLAVKMDQLAESSKLRVQFLEQCLVPLYNESARHQICRNNAEKALAAIDTALHHYQVPDDLTAIIEAGPVKNLTAYCAALERVKASMDFFSEFHTTTPEFDQVSMLYRAGRDNLIKEYRDLLRMHSKAVPSVMIFDAIVNNLRDPSISHDFAHFAETVYNDLKLVTQWFLSTKDSFDFMDVYASFRLAAMRDSLEQFRAFYKASSEAGTAGFTAVDTEMDRRSINASVGRDGSVRSGEADAGFDEDRRSISIVNADDVPGQAGGLLKPSALKRPFGKNTRKKAVPDSHGTPTAGLFQKLRRVKTGSGAAKKFASTRVAIDDDTYLTVEVYMAMVSALLKLIESEVGLMYGIIPDEHMREVFDRIVLPAVERFSSQGRELAEKILRHVQNGDFSAVILLLQVLEHLEMLRPLFAAALEGSTHDTQQNWTNVQLAFRLAVQRTMDGFLSSIKTTTDKVLPADGTVHEISSNTIAFVSNLVDYRPLFDSIIAAEAGQKDRKNVVGLGAKLAPAAQTLNFPQYLTSVVTHLLASMTTRAENYHDQTLKAVFLLNNISYMFNYLKQSGIIEVMKEDAPNVDRLITTRIMEQRTAYLDCWTPLTRLLNEAIAEATQLRTRSPHDVSMQTATNYDVQLKEKDRQALKDRCTAINKEIMIQASKQEKYSVPDQALRTSLQQQNRELIIALYNNYRERYVRIPFTKFHDKYLPYTTAQVSDMLDRFFSQDTFSLALGTTAQAFRSEE
ncbi:Exocyst complex component 7 [Hypsibius exemplaris]|uniref:Exocyst complex component 7 n=1 Tax=Hypsibius exemplaris TaxID=2072580 RepID=A0A9X6RK00_HYPEX|nr:Exocyst complex component 7 [Hypsibius exemplaris]